MKNSFFMLLIKFCAFRVFKRNHQMLLVLIYAGKQSPRMLLVLVYAGKHNHILKEGAGA